MYVTLNCSFSNYLTIGKVSKLWWHFEHVSKENSLQTCENVLNKINGNLRFICIDFLHISLYANIVVCAFDRASDNIYVDVLHTISIKNICFHWQAS